MSIDMWDGAILNCYNIIPLNLPKLISLQVIKCERNWSLLFILFLRLLNIISNTSQRLINSAYNQLQTLVSQKCSPNFKPKHQADGITFLEKLDSIRFP